MVRGPVAGVCCSLNRLGWHVLFSTVLCADLWGKMLLPSTCPQEVKRQLREGIERWQHSKTLCHHGVGTSIDAQLWREATIAIVARPKTAIGKASQTGSIRARWSGAPWT
eukprot:5933246-Pyramimonas_sp.AAC.1